MMADALNRRGFLGLLMAGVAGLALPKDALWLPNQELALPALEPSAVIGLTDVTKAIAAMIARYVDGKTARFDRVGDTDGPVTATHQVSVSWDRWPEEIDHYGLDTDRHCLPTAMALLRKVSGHHHFGALEVNLPSYRAVNCTVNGVTVRGIIGYDFEYQLYRPRFDVLVGS